jgi:ribosomal protein L11 methylase PrmA
MSAASVPKGVLEAFTTDPASFRDPAGRVVEKDGRILRVLTDRAANDWAWIHDRGLIDRLIRSGHLIDTHEVDPEAEGFVAPDVKYVLEHERVPFISYPYEWCFSALQAAALFHLDLQLALLAEEVTLIDASAYNVQFRGTRPVFIDVLSLRRYQDGEAWLGHRQFCEQFLNPLLLQTYCGIPFNAWYRGAMEGLPAAELSRLLRWRNKVSWRTLMHVTAPARLQRIAQKGKFHERLSTQKRVLPKRSLVALVRGLRTWIAGLKASSRGDSVWVAYAETSPYGQDEAIAKRKLVAEFVAACRPSRLLDLGCNTGEYAALALENGATTVIGLEADHTTADQAFRRAAAADLSFLPLVMDAADPSPARGWREAERRSLAQRAEFDALLALAFVHHLAIARNVPLDQALAWITGLAPRGIVEFVPKNDPTIGRMLAFREDIFSGYSLDQFTSILSRYARVVRQNIISRSGRVLFWYERDRR